jgi:hypothetical protein
MFIHDLIFKVYSNMRKQDNQMEYIVSFSFYLSQLCYLNLSKKYVINTTNYYYSVKFNYNNLDSFHLLL